MQGEDRIRVAVEWPYGAPTPLGQALGIEEISGVAIMVIVGDSTTITTVSTTTTSTSTATTVPGATTTSTSSTTSTTSTTVPGQCVATGMTFDPAPLALSNNNKHLEKATTFTVTTNGAGTCTGLRIAYPAVIRSGNTTLPAVGSLNGQRQHTVGANDYEWTRGDDQLFRVLTSGGAVIGSFELDID